jgi:hypothetical protein
MSNKYDNHAPVNISFLSAKTNKKINKAIEWDMLVIYATVMSIAFVSIWLYAMVNVAWQMLTI